MLEPFIFVGFSIPPTSLEYGSNISLEYGSKKVMIIGSALGVIGNFIKWGSVQQIEVWLGDEKFMQKIRIEAHKATTF